MPIYEYQCTACHYEFEKLQKISEEPLRLCPECDQEQLRKKVSASGFRLKGGGWYETDFKKDGKKNLAGDREKADADKTVSGKGADKPVSGKSAGSKSDSAGKAAAGT